MTEQLSLLDAIRQRDTGISRAADHADAIEEKWTDRAYQWICDYAEANPGRQFISETCTDAAAATGLVSPADPRAWGSPFQRAAKAGVIRKIGYSPSLRRHYSPTPRWESCHGNG